MQADWRDRILGELVPGVSRLWLAADPDNLLLEEVISQKLRESGFDLITYEDPVAFRYYYESCYRSRWDLGELTEQSVILRTAAGLITLPYDLLRAGRHLAFSLGALFPGLSYPVLAALPLADLDALYKAAEEHHPSQLGDNATRQFILKHVFDIAPELITEDADLLNMLLGWHYRARRMPADFSEYFVRTLRTAGRFSDWPLGTLVNDRQAFFTFLQERWPYFLDTIAPQEERSVAETASSYVPQHPGPLAIPFQDPDVRVYIDNLFLEGMLRPVHHPNAAGLAASWAGVGVRTDPQATLSRRLSHLLGTLHDSLPAADAKYAEWLAFAPRWAELVVLTYDKHRPPDPELSSSITALQEQLDSIFLDWVLSRYDGLHNQAAIPVMLHHIPAYLARRLKEPSRKHALLVLDGLALDQWILLREVLLNQRPTLTIQEEAVFAWLPTITSVSRQALFAGKAPYYFADSLNNNAKEEQFWTNYWLDDARGLSRDEVTYKKAIDEHALDQLEEMLSHPKLRVAGLVVNKVDSIMHGMQLGAAGMHNQVRQWAEQGFLAKLLDTLLARGFTVYITSDHGNIEGRGIGNPREGSIADLRGERVRVYPTPQLRARIEQRFPQAIAWSPSGLPAGFLPLFAPGRSAFVTQGTTTVTHGGISLEELVVPFIRIQGEDTNKP